VGDALNPPAVSNGNENLRKVQGNAHDMPTILLL